MSERADDKKDMNDSGMAVQVNYEEAGKILLACWDTKILCYDIGGHYKEKFADGHLRTLLNDIASVLGSIAEVE